MVSKLKVLSTALAVCLALVVVSAVALAAKPNQVRGGTYMGTLLPATRGIGVSFRVSSNGKKVTLLSITNIPIYCSGGGPPIPIRFKDAAISSKGAFTSKANYVIKVGPLKGQIGEKLKITGKFLKGRSEQGTLTTTYPHAAACGGKSPYTTKA
ncbi:MAG TPA: hypothetical protein VIG42_06550 [Solirubrobacteraceae bacterium]|jgi:hypothetical protein